MAGTQKDTLLQMCLIYSHILTLIRFLYPFANRIDAEELKQLLKKHNTSFTDEEIVELGELYYAGKAGGAVSIDRFIEAIDYAASKADEDKNVGDEHAQQTTRHPLGVGRCALEYMPRKHHHGNYTPEELDAKLTHVELSGFRDKLAYNAACPL